MLLEMKNITKMYGSFCANRNIDISLERGEVLAIVGENGAGKSTIMKVLYGLEDPTEGEIYIDGVKKNIKNPVDAIKNGIGMVQQNFMLFDSFSVMENIVYGSEPRKNKIFFDLKKTKEDVIECSKKYGLPIDENKKISELPVGLRQRVEILKVLYQNPDIVIFDEPTAVLTPSEISDLLITIRNIANQGKGVILITHKLAEVMEASDNVAIMRKGELVGYRKTSETNPEELSYLMVGRNPAKTEIKPLERGKELLKIENLSYIENGIKKLDDINLDVHEYEIVGVAGVSGNGQYELLASISGMQDNVTGNINIMGTNMANKSVLEITNKDTSFVPEDRNLTGCAPLSTLYESSIIGYHRKPENCNNGILNAENLNTIVNKNLAEYLVAYEETNQLCNELSGGNLQKLIMARELNKNSKLNIIAEPTRGIDIGAQEFIYEEILKKREEGKGIFLVSSDLQELMKLTDRLYILYNGKIVKEFQRNEYVIEEIGYYMLNGVGQKTA